MSLRYIVGTVLFSLCGVVSGRAPDYAALVKQVKEAVIYDLKDPDSAKFRNVRVTQGINHLTHAPNGFFVCGEVNAKNSFGGYNGFKGFLAYWPHGKMELVREGDLFYSGLIGSGQCDTVIKRF